jgi:branched-chain amino acid transport system permease protein
MSILMNQNRKTDISVLAASVCLAVLPWMFNLSRATSYYTDVMVFVAIHSIIAAGLSLLLGYAGQISLGQAAFYGIGAYTSGILTTRVGLSPWLGMLAGMFLAGGLAWAVGLPALRLRGHYLAMATLGFGMIFYIVFNEFIGLTGGPSGFGQIPSISLFGMEISSTVGFYYLVWGIAMGILWLSLNIVNSRPGRALRAIHHSEKAAAAAGINITRAKVQIFIISGIFGALAGSLYAHFVTFINPPPFDIFFSIKVLMMVVIGGIGSIWGAYLGAALLTFLPEWLTFLQDFDVLAYGVILLAIIMFSPDGLFALGSRLLASIRASGKQAH